MTTRPSEAERYVATTVAMLFGLRKKGLWVMLSAYFDESGTHDDSEFFVVAGLVASPDAWERLTKAWQRILASEEVEAFHMVDFCHSRSAFEGWPKERRDRLIIRLIDTIKKHVSFRTWSVVAMSDYRRIFSEPLDGFPYSLCSICCASQLRTVAQRRSIRIPYMFEGGGHGSALLFEEFRALLGSGQGDFYGMGALAVGESKLCPPLQAADIHAYEVHKYFTDQLKRAEPKVRRSFEELMLIREAGGGGYLLHREKLERLILGIKNGERPVRMEPDPLNRKVQLVRKVPRDSGGRGE